MPSATEDVARLCPLCRRFPCLLLMCSHGLPSSSCCGRGTLGHGGSGRKKAGMSPCADLHKVPLAEALFRALGGGQIGLPGRCPNAACARIRHKGACLFQDCRRVFWGLPAGFPGEDGGCRPRLGSVLAQSVQRGTSCLKKCLQRRPAGASCQRFLQNILIKTVALYVVLAKCSLLCLYVKVSTKKGAFATVSVTKEWQGA